MPLTSDGLLQPLPRVVVPVREPVDDQPAADRVGEVERLDGQPLAGEGVLRAAGSGPSRRGAGSPRTRSASPPRPPAAARSGGSSPAAASRALKAGGQQKRGRWWAIWRCHHAPVVRRVVAPDVQLARDAALGEQPAIRRVWGSDCVGCTSQAPWPTTSTIWSRLAQPVEVLAVQAGHVVRRVGEVRGLAAVAPGPPGATGRSFRRGRSRPGRGRRGSARAAARGRRRASSP